MSLTIKSEGDFEALAVGQYEGVCYRIVDMGTREEVYKDNPPKQVEHMTKSTQIQNERQDYLNKYVQSQEFKNQADTIGIPHELWKVIIFKLIGAGN